MKKILLLSDTHSFIDDNIKKYAKKVDEIWHAGDIGNIKVYDELKKKDKNWKRKKIKARFICSLSIFYLEKKIACIRGKVEGIISNNPQR